MQRLCCKDEAHIQRRSVRECMNLKGADSSLQFTMKTKLKRHVEQVLKGRHAFFSLTFTKTKAADCMGCYAMRNERCVSDYKIDEFCQKQLSQKDKPVLQSSIHPL